MSPDTCLQKNHQEIRFTYSYFQKIMVTQILLVEAVYKGPVTPQGSQHIGLNVISLK